MFCLKRKLRMFWMAETSLLATLSWVGVVVCGLASSPPVAAGIVQTPDQKAPAPQATPAASDGTAQPHGDAAAETPPDDHVKRGSARQTMITFLAAIDEADRGQIERYVDAVACLDLSSLADLPEDARASRGRKLASLLNEFIDARGIEIELVPNDPSAPVYTYHEAPDGRAIQIARNDEGMWLFTWASLELVENPPSDPAAEKAAPSPAETSVPAPKVAEVDSASIVPEEFQSARNTMRTFRDAMKDGRLAEAAECLDLSDIPLVARGEKGIEYASLLNEAIKRTQAVVLQDIPDTRSGKPHIFRKPDRHGMIVIARQGEGSNQPGYWLFTKRTVASLDGLYEALLTSGETIKDETQTAPTPFSLSLWLRTNIPEPLKAKWLLLRHWQWIGLVVVFFLGRTSRWLVTRILHGAVGLWLKRTGISVDESVQASSFKPVGILAAAAVWWIGLTWLSLDAGVLAVFLAAVKFIACWATVWTAYRAVDLVGDYFASLAEKTRTTMDDLLVPLVRKIAKTVVTVLGVYFIIRQFTDERPLELLAGLGLGGLALALAAQDTLKNLFGSLTVILDRPFKVGDWVLIGDAEGTVESLGFRSTRIRTFYNSQIVVPNSTLISAIVDNFGARRYRRFRTMLSLTYSTPVEKLEAFCEGVRELIRTHPHTRKDYFHVYVNAFAPSSIDILLYCFFETPDWSIELAQREQLILDIIRLARRLGVDFAFPTQTVHVEPGSAPVELSHPPSPPRA